MTPSKHTPKIKLDEWVELIRHREMPIFDYTVQQVLAVSHNERAPASELARVVLQDVSLTARVLKLANSVYYNPIGSSASSGISTISRAVVVLGFNTVGNMCLAATLVDALVQGSVKQRVAAELARAIHAAVQARGLAVERGDKSPEEIFIATLLYRIGELAFWCFSGEVGEAVDHLSRQPGWTSEQAQERLLGFRLSQLSVELIKVWHLTDLLRDAVANPGCKDERIQIIVLGQQIAQCAEEKGWKSQDMGHLVDKAAGMLQQPISQVQSLFYHKARTAAGMATDFGAKAAADLIPQPGIDICAESPQDTDRQPTTQPAATVSPHPQPDPMLQLRALRELSLNLEEGKYDFSLIMELVLEGIYRGVGVDRVLFALATPDKQAIKAKCALGDEHEELTRRFQFVRPTDQPHLLFEVMERQVPRYISKRRHREQQSIIPPILTQLIGEVSFMIAPIIVINQCIGLFYADRALSGRPLDRECFESFKHLAQQANMGLSLAAARRRTLTHPHF